MNDRRVLDGKSGVSLMDSERVVRDNPTKCGLIRGLRDQEGRETEMISNG